METQQTQRNLYSNIKLLAPDGFVLAKITQRRAEWYKRKGLVDEIDEKTLKLRFEPAGRKVLSAWYLVEHKNICVICGCNEPAELEKHHIVPVCFRRWLPEELTSRRSFDLTLVCENCHDEYEVSANEFKRVLAKEAGVALEGWTDEEKVKLHTIRAIKTLLKYQLRETQTGLDVMRPEFKAKLINLVEKGGFGIKQETADHLSKEINDELEGRYKRVVEFYEPKEFIIRWRKHFLEFAKPQFVDQTWLDDVEKVE